MLRRTRDLAYCSKLQQNAGISWRKEAVLDRKTPYLGAAYYPEDWPLEQIDSDIALMKEAGLNCVRIWRG